jgi:hypothetical protein
MAYKIRYDETNQPTKSNPFRAQVLTAAILLAFLFVANIFWEQGSRVVRNYLLPEEGKVVTAAESLATELENGTSFLDAMEVFCESIVNGE